MTAFYISNFFSSKKVDNISNISDSIAVDLLSNETQFLLKEISCSDDSFNPVAQQIGELGDKLTYAEGEFGSDDSRVVYLKKYYSLLQIKDYIIGKKIADKCGKSKKPIFMIYMYPSLSSCADCGKQSAVLSELRSVYPELRVYTFDYDLDLGPIKTLRAIYKINSTTTFPILVVEDKAYYGYKNLEELQDLLPSSLKEATSTTQAATNTVKKAAPVKSKN